MGKLEEREMLQQPNVTVIIPVYNVTAFIERCARSLMEQTLYGVEFIFVDDCTPDDSITILKRVLEEYPNRTNEIKILHNEHNYGLAATRFIGMNEARGRYILHCDSDDWVEPSMLEDMYIKAIETDADIVCCNAIKEGATSQVRYEYEYDEETVENGLLKFRLNDVYTAIWNKLVRRELYICHNIHPYEGINMAEDTALTLRLRYFSRRTVVVHKALYHYNRMNVGSMCAASKPEYIEQLIHLAYLIEQFFVEQHEEKRFRHVINYIKFISKQSYLRNDKNLQKWKSIYPESHRDIFRFSYFSLMGRIKWWACAYLYMPFFKIKK